MDTGGVEFAPIYDYVAGKDVMRVATGGLVDIGIAGSPAALNSQFSVSIDPASAPTYAQLWRQSTGGILGGVYKSGGFFNDPALVADTAQLYYRGGTPAGGGNTDLSVIKSAGGVFKEYIIFDGTLGGTLATPTLTNTARAQSYIENSAGRLSLGVAIAGTGSPLLPRLTLAPTTGYVGIWNVSPAANLDIGNALTSDVDMIALTDTSAAAGTILGINFKYVLGSMARISAGFGSGGANSFLAFNVADASHVTQERMRIDVSGNVTIGGTVSAGGYTSTAVDGQRALTMTPNSTYTIPPSSYGMAGEGTNLKLFRNGVKAIDISELDVDTQALNLVTSGSVSAKIKVLALATGTCTIGVSCDGTSDRIARGGIVEIIRLGVLTLPAKVTGLSLCAIARGTYTIQLAAAGSDYFRDKATEGSAAGTITSDGTKGARVCVVGSGENNVWTVYGKDGTFTVP
jgi:hypothetical protein